ncbi:hypothetical protein ABLE68_01605 [Nocardioides sp. CN2-186]|uniref:hypothetical protein n=1 Tax=Nocardioides tweenelious TaxID=3156607 RepID=UPI0032B5101C
MTVLDRVASTGPAPLRTAWPRVTLLLAVATALVRLPFLALPLSPDEGGYLLVASQWSAGPSTYGAYFVDRPPLLMGLFGLADATGGAVPLRLLGILAAVTAVLLAGRLGGWLPAATAAVFVSTPLFDAMQVDGELLAVPFVVGGLLVLVRSLRATTPQAAYAGSVGAGVLATCAALVKQNVVDVFVVAAVLLVTLALGGQWRSAVRRTVVFGAGALGALVVALLPSAARGTGPASLWDALVTFRAEAAAVIHASANVATPDRFHTLLIALALSGAPVVVAAALLGFRRPETGPDLRWAALALLAWELVGAALGGSYWRHYLLAVVPGLVLLMAAVRPTRATRGALAVAALSTAVSLVGFAAAPPSAGADQAVSAYLRDHARPTDTVVVAFGHPNIVRDAGLTSPYEHLWSLSVRVRDPQLHDLADLLASSESPRWVVVDGASLATWGVDPTAAQVELDRRYTEVTADGDWHVFQRR